MNLLFTLSLLLFGITFVRSRPDTLEYNTPFVYKPVKELPADIPEGCSQKDANMNECLRSFFQTMTPRIKNGIPELNIPPMDPFELGKANYELTSGIVQGRVALKDIRVVGLSTLIFDQVNYEENNGKVRMEIIAHIPQIIVDGVYKADVKFNDAKMTPKGYFNLTVTNIKLHVRPEGELYEKDDHTYLKLTKFNSKQPDLGDVKIYATGLFPDPDLNAVILQFVNQYWRQIYTALYPEVRNTVDPFMLGQMNDFLAALPFDLILKNQ